ncbi:hypothetical protein PQX77_002436 [Marasmius sp. AFHP31]|nr:hypothetical protein PQX77_002436 [Marasmius sp. AFHP31]
MSNGPPDSATTSSPNNVSRLAVNRLGLFILNRALGRKERATVTKSREQLEEFLNDPAVHGPRTEDERLDLSGNTVKDMQQSPWNRMLSFELAQKALSLVPEEAVLGGYSTSVVTWMGFFDKKFISVFRDKLKAKKEAESRAILDKKENKDSSGSVRKKKFKDRELVASTMQQHCRDSGDHSNEIMWGYLIRSLWEFGEDGMSDEENGQQDGKKVKFVHGIDFRHPDFDPLFRVIVDNARKEHPGIFPSRGRDRDPRIPSGRIVQRTPPPGIAEGRFRPGYLEARAREGNPYTEFAAYDFPASRYSL